MNAIESLVLDLIGEDKNNPDVFVEGSDSFQFLRDSVNNAITELSIATGAVTKVYHLVTQANRQFYRLRFTSDVYAYPIEVFDRTNSRILEQVTIPEMERIDPQWQKLNGYPTHYFPVGYDAIGLWRKPGNSGQVMEVKCVVTPKAYGSDTSKFPKVREAFQRAASYYVVSEYYASRGDAGRATEYYKMYQEVAGLMRFSPGYQSQIRQAANGYRSDLQPLAD